MRADSHLDRRKFVPTSVPSWIGETTRERQAIKKPFAKINCEYCGPYCIADFFHEEFLTDVTMKNCFINGGGENLKPNETNFEKSFAAVEMVRT